MTWSTVTLQVTTPLFNGGHVPRADGEAVPPEDAEIRVPSLLGAMRYWFRALAGAHLGKDLAALHRWEGAVFGRAATGDDQPASSPVQWRVRRQPRVTPVDDPHGWLPSEGRSGFDQGNDRWLVYLLGQGLGDLGTCTVRRPYIAPDETFDLQFRLRRTDTTGRTALALHLASLWLTCTFAGLGARTRRGFGGVTIQQVRLAPDVPALWSGLLTSVPKGPWGELGRVWCQQLDFFVRQFTSAGQAVPPPARWVQAPEHPVLGPGPERSGRELTAAALGPGFTDWQQALQHAGYAWRTFRATEGGKGHYPEPKVKTPEWLNVVHGDKTWFPLGAYGLPIVFKGNRIAQVIADGAKSRRASPVWMRPVKVGDRWHVFSFAFLTRLLPADGTATVRLDRPDRLPKEITVPEEFSLDLAREWFEWHSGVEMPEPAARGRR